VPIAEGELLNSLRFRAVVQSRKLSIQDLIMVTPSQPTRIISATAKLDIALDAT
jgi:hypothetical protein